MRRLILTSVLCLTACARPDPIIPAELTRPVAAKCPPGYTSGALGACLLAHAEALALANAKLAQIGALTAQ